MRLFILFLLLIYSKSILALSIDDSVKSTISNNLKVKIAFEKLNESKEIIEVAIGKKLPTVTGTISGTYSNSCLLYTSPSPRDPKISRMPSSA